MLVKLNQLEYYENQIVDGIFQFVNRSIEYNAYTNAQKKHLTSIFVIFQKTMADNKIEETSPEYFREAFQMFSDIEGKIVGRLQSFVDTDPTAKQCFDILTPQQQEKFGPNGYRVYVQTTNLFCSYLRMFFAKVTSNYACRPLNEINQENYIEEVQRVHDLVQKNCSFCDLYKLNTKNDKQVTFLTDYIFLSIFNGIHENCMEKEEKQKVEDLAESTLSSGVCQTNRA